jgi:hypothetical protein
MAEELSEDSLKSVLGAMLNAVDEESAAAYRAFSNTPQALAAVKAIEEGEPDHFYFALQYPMGKLIDGLLSGHTPKDADDIRFLFKNSQLIERHVRRIIDKHEGMSCCADKSHSVLRALLRFLRTGQEIKWNYDQQYTFHLPKIAFTDHATTFAFFKSLKNLQLGYPEPYLKALLAAEEAAQAAKLTAKPECD